MKILVDMNLSPDWVTILNNHGIVSIHWSTVRDPRAKDSEIIQWAQENGYVDFTHDLDFGGILALTQARGPSVIQVRTHDVTPSKLGTALVEVLNRNQTLIELGCLIVLDEARARIRILPLPL